MTAAVEGRTAAAAAVREFRVRVSTLLIEAVLAMDLRGAGDSDNPPWADETKRDLFRRLQSSIAV